MTETVLNLWPLGVFVQLSQLATWGLIFRTIWRIDWTFSFVSALTAIWLVKLICADFLSLPGLFNRAGVFFVDSSILAMGLFFIVYRGVELPRVRLPKLRPGPKLPYVFLAFLLSLVAFSAVFVPQMNWDSMTYHLPRAAMWLQEGSVGFFETNNSRENHAQVLPSVLYAFGLAYSPWGAAVAFPNFLAATLIILSIGSVLRAFSNDTAALVGMFFAASIPMFLVQASSTQTDLLASFALAGVFSTIARIVKEGRRQLSPFDVFVIGLSTAFAVSSKATAALLLLPLLIAIPWLAGLDRKSWELLKVAMWATPMVVLTASPYIVRLLRDADGSWDVGGQVFVGSVTLSGALGNVIKMTAASLQFPVDGWGDALEANAHRVANWLSFELNQEATNFGSGDFYVIDSFVGDSSLGFPVHFLVACLALLSLPILPGQRGHRFRWILVGIAQFLVIATLIRWQPWITRFLFASFLPLAVSVGLTAARWSGWWRTSVLATLLVPAVLVSVWLPGRSILPRPDLDSLRDGRIVLESPDFSGASPDPFPASHMRGDTAEVRRSLDQAAGEELEAIVVIAGGDDPKFHVWVAAKTSKPSLPVFYSY